jgi:hypothetical protein
MALSPHVQLGSQGPLNALETEFALGDDGAYALVKRAGTTANPDGMAELLFFDPVSLATISSEGSSGGKYAHLAFTISGGGAYVATPSTGTGGVGSEATLVPGSWAGWSLAPSIQVGGIVPISNGDWAWAQGNAQSANAARRDYANINDAAVAVIRHVLPLSNAVSREMGGSICMTTTNRYVASVPNLGDGGEVFPSSCPPTLTHVAGYHTHVNAPEDSPSGADASNYYFHYPGKSGFIGVAADLSPDQPIDCAPGGLGNIWKFTMDLSKAWDALNPPFLLRSVIACAPFK